MSTIKALAPAHPDSRYGFETLRTALLEAEDELLRAAAIEIKGIDFDFDTMSIGLLPNQPGAGGWMALLALAGNPFSDLEEVSEIIADFKRGGYLDTKLLENFLEKCSDPRVQTFQALLYQNVSFEIAERRRLSVETMRALCDTTLSDKIKGVKAPFYVEEYMHNMMKKIPPKAHVLQCITLPETFYGSLAEVALQSVGKQIDTNTLVFHRHEGWQRQTRGSFFPSAFIHLCGEKYELRGWMVRTANSYDTYFVGSKGKMFMYDSHDNSYPSSFAIPETLQQISTFEECYVKGGSSLMRNMLTEELNELIADICINGELFVYERVQMLQGSRKEESKGEVAERSQGVHDCSKAEEEIFAPEEDEKVLPPSLMCQELDVTEITCYVREKQKGFAALLFLLTLGTPSLMDLMQEQREGEVSLNTIKRQVAKTLQHFLNTGELDIEALHHLWIKCTDADQRVAEEKRAIASLGAHALQYESDGVITKKTLPPDVWKPPRAEEYIRNFLKVFNQKGAFDSCLLPEAFQGTLGEWCSQASIQVGGAKNLVFVRPKGWEPSEKASLFPNRMLSLGKHLYILRGLMILSRSDEDDEILKGEYDTYLFEGDQVFEYQTQYSRLSSEKTDSVECLKLDETVEEILSQEKYYTSEALSQQAVSSEEREDLENLMIRLRQESDLLLYARVVFY